MTTATSTSSGSKKVPAEPGNGAILGLVAGDGKLPGILAKSARDKGYKVVALCLSEEAQARVEANCIKTHIVFAGQLGRNLHLLDQESVKQIVFVGRVPKIDLLKNITKLDWTAVRELSRMPDFNDDTIQKTMGNVLTRRGITVRTQSEFLTELFPDFGVLSKRTPTAQEYADIDFGMKIAKEISRLDIGQTVIVREQMILAIEAIEGTDKAIRRAVDLAKAPVVVVKVAKPGQDQRFDIPTVGMNTLNSMLAPTAGGVLAVEAHETMVVEQEEMVQFCDQHQISMVAI